MTPTSESIISMIFCMRLYGDDFDHQCLTTQPTVLHSNLDSDVKALSGGMKFKSIIS